MKFYERFQMELMVNFGENRPLFIEEFGGGGGGG